mmetsp:Transcript_77834/g.195730  ORF Transcript_77834/g.195730 Transcript_77834/m.195730 type:complete len:278 (+) Transcript_77834:821-1654(+)
MICTCPFSAAQRMGGTPCSSTDSGLAPASSRSFAPSVSPHLAATANNDTCGACAHFVWTHVCDRAGMPPNKSATCHKAFVFCSQAPQPRQRDANSWSFVFMAIGSKHTAIILATEASKSPKASCNSLALPHANHCSTSCSATPRTLGFKMRFRIASRSSFRLAFASIALTSTSAFEMRFNVSTSLSKGPHSPDNVKHFLKSDVRWTSYKHQIRFKGCVHSSRTIMTPYTAFAKAALNGPSSGELPTSSAAACWFNAKRQIQKTTMEEGPTGQDEAKA